MPITSRSSRLRKISTLRLILGGAALQRCGNCIVLSEALAAEVSLSARELVFPQPARARGYTTEAPCKPCCKLIREDLCQRESCAGEVVRN